MSKVNYIHQRFVIDGVVSNRGGITIAFRELDTGEIEYALARCSPNDNFSKAMGRVKAEGRLKSDSYRQTSNLSWLEFVKTNAFNLRVPG